MEFKIKLERGGETHEISIDEEGYISALNEIKLPLQIAPTFVNILRQLTGFMEEHRNRKRRGLACDSHPKRG